MFERCERALYVSTPYEFLVSCLGIVGLHMGQIIGILVRVECGRRRFEVSCLGIVGLHMGGHEQLEQVTFRNLKGAFRE